MPFNSSRVKVDSNTLSSIRKGQVLRDLKR